MSALESLVGEMTVSQLAAQAGVSVGTLVELAMGKKAKAPKAQRAAPKKAKGGVDTGGGGVDTRSAKGRELFQGKVLDAIKDQGGRVSAQDIRKAVGGTPDQIRKAVNRWIEDGELNYSGKARGTRYFV